MKTALFTSILSLSFLIACSQDKTATCCTSSAKKFASFAADNTFVNAHDTPKKYIHKSRQGGTTITLSCPDGKQATGYVILAKNETKNWIFIFHEWWGLNDNIKKWGEDLYNKLGNVNILALDMYDGKMTTDQETAAKYMKGFSQQRGTAIVKGALAYVGEKAKIGTIGWCFGGGQSLQAALTLGNQAIACVMYYGMPEGDINRLKMLNTDVLNIWGRKDKWINKEIMDKFKQAMERAQKQLTVYAYDANHAFANPSNPHFDQKAYKNARRKTLAYFKSKMR